MKIAIIDHVGNKGGVSRVIRKLVPGMLATDNNINITYFGNPMSMERENIFKDLDHKNINIKKLNSLYFSEDYTSKNYLKKIAKVLQKKYKNVINFLHPVFSGNLKKEIEKKVVNFDIAYFPWPYLIEWPNLNCSVAATFHDFNFKYYFSGVPTYNKSQLNLLNKQVPVWLKNSTIIVSNKFTASELKNFYSELGKEINVINLGPYSDTKNDYDKIESETVLKKYKITKPYIFCGTNTAAHKNLNPLFAAHNLLKNKGIIIKLVITGAGTEIIRGNSCEVGLKLNSENPDVLGTGYINNKELDIIINNSSLVVNPEIYTSDNGPATDGWARSIPVIISNIPSNVEHLTDQKVNAELFNPRDPNDLAEKILQVLNNSEKYKNIAIESKKQMEKFNWDKASKEYLEVFKKTISNFKN